MVPALINLGDSTRARSLPEVVHTQLKKEKKKERKTL